METLIASIPAFIGMILGWLLSVFSDLLKESRDKQKRKIDHKKSKIEEAAVLISSIENAQTDLLTQVSKRILLNNPLNLEKDDSINKLRMLIYFYLPSLKQDFDKINKDIFEFSSLITFILTQAQFDNKETMNQSSILKYGIIMQDCEELLKKLTTEMNTMLDQI